MSANQDFEDVCICGNGTFFRYEYERIFYGKACQKCWKEWLVPTSGDQHRPLVTPQITLPEFRRAFPVTAARKEIKKTDVKLLKPGDHVMWQRPYVVWHHAIVIEVPSLIENGQGNGEGGGDTSCENIGSTDSNRNNAEAEVEDRTDAIHQSDVDLPHDEPANYTDGNLTESNNEGRVERVLRLDIQAANNAYRNDVPDGALTSSTGGRRNSDQLRVLHWSLSKGSIKIHKTDVNLSSERGRMFLASYDSQIIKRNPPHLVLARASALEGSTDYHFFNKNCENFARFCKTGINYNHQFPWLMLKLDDTFTTSLARLMKAASVIPTVSVILFAEGIEYSWTVQYEIIGACFVLILEMISFLIDLGNMYFEFKYPSSCYTLRGEEFRQAVVMRFFEFLFGATGMICGAIACEQFAYRVGKRICPGLGTLIGFTIGLVVGTFGGFVLGTLGKALGNAIGICIGRSDCCKKKRDLEIEVDPQNQDEDDDGTSSQGRNTPGAASNNQLLLTEPNEQQNHKQRRMRKIYRPSSWEARFGLCVIIFSSILLYAFTRQYKETYEVFRGSILSTCVVEKATYLSAPYPCPAIQVHLYGNQSNSWIDGINQSDASITGSNLSHLHIGKGWSQSNSTIFISGQSDLNVTTQMFEDENAFRIGNCSYQPYCLNNDSLTVRRTKKYVAKYGTPGNTFPCYHQYYDKSMVIRKLAPEVNFVHKFLWPSLGVFIGLTLVLHAVFRKSQKGENCFVTLTIVLGFRSYFDLFERCWCCL